jgi:hypothetical protein
MATFMVCPFHSIDAAPPELAPLGWHVAQLVPVEFFPSVVSLKSFSPLFMEASSVSGFISIIILFMASTFSCGINGLIASAGLIISEFSAIAAGAKAKVITDASKTALNRILHLHLKSLGDSWLEPA